MRTDDYKKIILKMFSRDEFYGYDIHKKLKQEGMKIELTQLYRILNEMDEESLLKSRWEKSTTGPRKKIYIIDEEGKRKLKEILLDAVKTVHDFYGDYLISLYPEIKVFDEIFDWLTKGMKGNEKISYLINNNSPMHEMVIQNLIRKVPQGRLYTFSSKNFTRQLNVESGAPMGGDHENIPLKDGFLDMVLTIDLPQVDKLEASLVELNRVLDENGKLGIIIPSILLKRQADPLTIGDFIEKNEHEIIEQGEYMEKNRLLTLIKYYFQNVKEKEIVHMTLLQAHMPIRH